MKQKLDILEEKIIKLINIVHELRKENSELQAQIKKKDSIIENFKTNTVEAVERIDKLTEILKKEGIIEETS